MQVDASEIIAQPPSHAEPAGHNRPVPPAATFAALTMALMVPVLAMLALGIGMGSASGPSLPASRLWPCLFTASVAGVLSSWVWSLRGRETAAMLFCASGAATYAFCLGAAIFSLPGQLSDFVVSAAILVNVIGASAFGLVMIALFTRYPSRLPGAFAIILAAAGVFGGWTIAALIGPFDILIEIHRITLAEMVAILALVGAQLKASRQDPVAHAIAMWLGASVSIGAGGFIALVALPNSLLLPPLIPEEFGFLFFVIIYVALALALLRYRIFGMGRWAFRLLFAVGAALVVLAVDVFIIMALVVDPAQATGIALVMVALAYLPARSWLWERLVSIPGRARALHLGEVAGVALAPSSAEREMAWRTLLERTFAPLAIEPSGQAPRSATIEDDGRALRVPGTDGNAALVLRDRDGARRLFAPEDVALADELALLVGQLGQARNAYDRGVAFERSRIAKDIHDNLGAQLLTALHAPVGDRKNELIREIIRDLRDVIRNAEGEVTALGALLADLRAETAERVELAGLWLDWQIGEIPAAAPGRATAKVLSAVLREAVSNALRHARAGRIAIAIGSEDENLSVVIVDDGAGFDPTLPWTGRGLVNMRTRVEDLGGTFACQSGPPGTSIKALLPLAPG